MNFKKIGEGHIFAISRDLVTWAKNSYFQNLLRITQYGSRLFGIDASSDPAKFQGDWPSGSPLIGAWSSFFAPNVSVCQVAPACQADSFRPKVDFNDFWPAKSIQRVNIYVSDEFEENRSRSHFCPIK